MFFRATLTLVSNTRFLHTLFNVLCYSYLCCLTCRDDFIRVAEHAVWCCRKGFPACQERLSRALIMPVWRCRKHRPTCRECAWRLPYWYKRMYEWVRMVLRERFCAGFVFCFAIFCCQNFYCGNVYLCIPRLRDASPVRSATVYGCDGGARWSGVWCQAMAGALGDRIVCVIVDEYCRCCDVSRWQRCCWDGNYSYFMAFYVLIINCLLCDNIVLVCL